jgi:predicted acetyltransferase
MIDTDENGGAPGDFEFLDPGPLEDGELQLEIEELRPADPAKGYVPCYAFKMRLAGSDEKAGNVDLRAGYTHDIIMYGGNLAYGVNPAQRGRHLAERACRLLFPLARRHGMPVLWITCNPDNWPSRRTCERLGAVLVGIVDLPEYSDMYQEGERQKCRYRLES